MLLWKVVLSLVLHTVRVTINCTSCSSQVFVTSSGKYNELGYPFGYLKASTTLTCVNLFVMPYNYPVLLPLLDATVTHDIHEEKMENGQTPPDGFLSKSAPPEFMNMARDGIPPNQLDSPSDEFINLSKDGSIHKPGSNALVGAVKNCSFSSDDPKVIVASTLGTVPNTLHITPAMAQGINADIKHQLMKEVRKFGRKYERIFILLEEVQGPLEMKKQFVEFTIKEAARFKRRVLIQYLEKVLEKIDSHHLLNSINHINNSSSC
ncbi:Protein DDX26B [Tupaia chinensis]|uniref:Protein DDX26B n=1 Tax=Tupaia chinensis TaxID=246437 RepID=L9J9D6_TUPCH|nr:Protein DDX26B [Tupaia chinensis]